MLATTTRVHRRGRQPGQPRDGPLATANVIAADWEQVPAIAVDERPESAYKRRLLGDLDRTNPCPNSPR
jgi:hypothetical protein